jgi:hypothetical protein
MKECNPEQDLDGKVYKTVDIFEAAAILGAGISADNIYSRIRRGTLNAHMDENGKWCIPVSELERIKKETDICVNCHEPAISLVIVKYHSHDRIEFILCDKCAASAEIAYGRQGGVLEIVSYALFGEGWLKP